MTTFDKIMALPEPERSAFGHPVLTVRWWDESEIKALTKQSWFSSLRSDLNKGAKVTLNLGVFKLEQGGVAYEMTQAEAIGTVADLLEKVQPMTAGEFQQALNRSIAKTRFESQLVMLEGQFHTDIAKRKKVELMLTHVADYFGLETRPRDWSRVIKETELDTCIPKLKVLYDLTGGDLEVGNYWSADPNNLRRQPIRGVDMVSAGLQLIGATGELKHLVLPVDAVKSFPHPGGFGARVLGWTEQGDGSLMLRVIALASLYFFKELPVPGA